MRVIDKRREEKGRKGQTVWCLKRVRREFCGKTQLSLEERKEAIGDDKDDPDTQTIGPQSPLPLPSPPRHRSVILSGPTAFRSSAPTGKTQRVSFFRNRWLAFTLFETSLKRVAQRLEGQNTHTHTYTHKGKLFCCDKYSNLAD